MRVGSQGTQDFRVRWKGTEHGGSRRSSAAASSECRREHRASASDQTGEQQKGGCSPREGRGIRGGRR